MIKISPVNFKSIYNIGSKNIIGNPISKNYNVSFGQYDYFEKGKDKSKKTAEDSSKYTYLESERNQTRTPYYPLSGVSAVEPIDDIKDTIGSVAIAGGIFLLGIAVTDTIAKAMPSNDDNLYTQDGYYIGNVDDFKLQPSDIKVDLKEGILKINGTGINIDKSRYDSSISDPEQGVFKSADGKLDIDLAHNKYIDQANGIIVDPDAKISAFTTADGSLKSLLLPNFTGAWSPDMSSGGGDFSMFGFLRPEEHNYTGIQAIDNIANYFNDLIKGIDRQQIEDYIAEQDRLFMERLDEDLSNSTIKNYMTENNIDPDVATKIAKYADDIRLKEYMLDNFPDLAEKVNISSIDQFVENIHAHGVNYDDANGLIDIINNDYTNPDM